MEKISENPSFSIENLYGQWHILYTNFPMWTKSYRKSPSLNYAYHPGDETYCIYDLVLFTKNRKTKSIKGYNRLVSEQDLSFEWKGAGLLSLLRSRWKIIHFEADWMIIYFEKTLFTPEGYDVVSRNIDLKPTKEKDINEMIKTLQLPKLARIQ